MVGRARLLLLLELLLLELLELELLQMLELLLQQRQRVASAPGLHAQALQLRARTRRRK